MRGRVGKRGGLVTNHRDSKSVITNHRLSRCFNHNHRKWHREYWNHKSQTNYFANSQITEFFIWPSQITQTIPLSKVTDLFSAFSENTDFKIVQSQVTEIPLASHTPLIHCGTLAGTRHPWPVSDFSSKVSPVWAPALPNDFPGDWSWNIFYDHSPSSAYSRRAIASWWLNYVLLVPPYGLGGLSLPRNSVSRLTGWLDMTLIGWLGRKARTTTFLSQY